MGTPYYARILDFFYHRDSFSPRHLELHPVERRHIKRKHFRVDLRRADGLMAHQALQHLQRYAGIQHMHRVTVTERVRGHRYREPDSVSRSYLHGLIQSGADVMSQMRAFSVLPVRLLRRSSGIFSVATIICNWLTYWRSDSGTSR